MNCVVMSGCLRQNSRQIIPKTGSCERSFWQRFCVCSCSGWRRKLGGGGGGLDIYGIVVGMGGCYIRGCRGEGLVWRGLDNLKRVALFWCGV